MAYTAMPNPDLYRSAIRAGVAIWYTVDASLAGVPVAGATDLRPTGGSITDTTKAGVRRTLNLQLAPEPGLYDLLSPIGTMLTVTAHVRLADRSTVDIPMGVFDVDSQTISEGGGGLSLTAPDKWVRIQRARFIGPAPSYANVTVLEQLVRMVRDALGVSETVYVLATRDALMSPVVWEKDRDKAMIELAESIGAWVYFDRNGTATIADIPTAGTSADWLIDASASGVLIELDRERSRTTTRNVVVVSSSAADEEKFPVQYVWDDEPLSPTYAGTDPLHSVGVGPFGVVPMYYSTPIALDAFAARQAGATILSRVVGLASSVSLGQVPNPAVDAFDTLDVMPPARSRAMVTGYVGGDGFGSLPFGEGPFGEGERGRPLVAYSSEGAFLERHVADTVTHPLTVGSAQNIEGRSTRSEEIDGGS